ncbi:HD-GYP domain-containing protein [Chrysiogenes arsenatis]|uniref:HD-GYP domain-containing protein n=1 Tax=Chrysiogenes arsenatis TaxID=309797 RepID=UPI00041A175E|nr:HD domain-containing phosphohydrolase [Chrysiogenes arsenatis]
MRMVPVELLERGMKLGERIDGDGQTMLNRGVILTDRYIQALKAIKIAYVVIDDSETADIDIDSTISAEVHRRGTQAVQKVFNSVENTVGAVQKNLKCSLDAALDDQRFNTFMRNTQVFGQMQDYVVTLIDEIANSPAGIAINSLKTHDMGQFQHSIDVAVMSLAVSKELNLPQKHLDELALGAMLHDIGKIVVPSDILNRHVRDLSPQDRQLVHSHPLLGRKILLSNPKMAQKTRVILIATQHHEHHDGTGYPHRLTGNKTVWSMAVEKQQSGGIFHLAEILSIANVFDNLTSVRPNVPRPLSYLDAALVMTNRMYSHFHPVYLDIFLKLLKVFPVGSNLQVHEGRYKGYIGTVVKSNPANKLSPVVRLFYDNQLRRLSEPIEIDLATDQEVIVTRRSVAEIPELDHAF